MIGKGLSTRVELAGETFELFPQCGMLWPTQDALLLADLHLGKVNHFRKSGIPVPSKANDKNIEQLVDLIQLANPKRVIFLGDLFHSHYNSEWEVFGEVVRHFVGVDFELVMGNHDIMSAVQYERKGIRVYDRLILNSFLLTHHPQEELDDEYYNLAGHVHPGVRLVGKGRQSLTLPCFHFGKRQGFLPAFGMFTGIARVRPEKEDRIFAIVNKEIVAVN